MSNMMFMHELKALHNLPLLTLNICWKKSITSPKVSKPGSHNHEEEAL
jgi:hypothetical protein